MSKIEKIVQFIKKGCSQSKRIGLELEHFLCNSDYELISYEEAAQCLEEICRQIKGTGYYENGNILGVFGEEYSLSLEPGCQLEISIAPKDNIEEIREIYEEFRTLFDEIVGRRGYLLLEKGVFPMIENGQMGIDEIPLIPKERYEIMDRYFESTGRFGKYMMRATASTQVSVDFSSEEDAMKKMRVLEKLSPIFALLTETRGHLGREKKWKSYNLRSQIWRNVDEVRCGYPKESVSECWSFRDYARYVYSNPCILLPDGDGFVDLKNKSADDFLGDKEMDEDTISYLLSMFFPTVRLKQYIEFRVADSMPVHRALGFAAMVRAIVYTEELLDKMDQELLFIKETSEIYKTEDAVCAFGYQAEVYGRTALEWIEYLTNLAMNVCRKEEKALISQMKPLAVVNHEYRKLVKGREQAHADSARGIRDYLMQSTAKYHNRVVKTLYIPKLFTEKDTQYFEEIITVLFGIFDKVIAEYEKNQEYRRLFGFPKELEELILREKKYRCNIPMARADIFYNDETQEFKFCEFNTDGTSAMNEDRELNIAFSHSLAYQEFAENHELFTFELFDTWVKEALCAYREFAGEESRLPHVAIVDFMENATVNEFVIFKERFEKSGCQAEVCDIRELTWDGSSCRTKSGMKVDVIYRRAVTTDILSHYSEIGDFLDAVRSGKICLLGDFRTQIVHNKILFKILHLEETAKLLTLKEQAFVKAHVPLTISLDDLFLEKNKKLCEQVYEDKDSWIIKPEDSYGSKGVCAGVELKDREEWKKRVGEARGKDYILQEFTHPYRLENIELLQENPTWITTSNMSGLFAYNHKFYGVYSRMSFEEMISTQYNEMSLPTILVK